ncbi:MAG: hypothetical protein KGH94_04275 [Candidatus Micrarchaeota archaeon]|nr:hypothetical protein [Candidatus Micrarchaeota archaeon]
MVLISTKPQSKQAAEPAQTQRRVGVSDEAAVKAAVFSVFFRPASDEEKAQSESLRKEKEKSSKA